MDIPTSTAYLAEIAPARHRGKVLGVLTQITWILGALTSSRAPPPAAGARPARGQAALPAALVLLGRQGLPESPRWLIAHGRTEQARQTLASFGVEATANSHLFSVNSARSWSAASMPPLPATAC